MLRFLCSFAALALLVGTSSLEAQVIRVSYAETPRFGLGRHYVNPASENTVVEVKMPRLRIKQSGLLTSRLSRKEVERWKAMQRRILSTDADGRWLHPTLYELWDWAEHSGHQVYLEFQAGYTIPNSTAGSFNIERFDPSGKRHTAVLKLCLANIDQAVSGPHVARPNGFIPFSELQREERYLEVLSHELAHVKHVLGSLLRSYLVQKLVEDTNDLLLLLARNKPIGLLEAGLKARISQRDTLLRELEDQAEMAEEIVWQELVASRKARAELLTATYSRRR